MGLAEELDKELGIETKVVTKVPAKVSTRLKPGQNPAAFLPEEGGTMRTDIKAYIPLNWDSKKIPSSKEDQKKLKEAEEEVFASKTSVLSPDIERALDLELGLGEGASPKTKPKKSTDINDLIFRVGKILGGENQAPPESMYGEGGGKAFAKGTASAATGVASWIPASMYMAGKIAQPFYTGKPVDLLDAAETAKGIQEFLTYVPKDKEAQKVAEVYAKPFTWLGEKGHESEEFWLKKADEVTNPVSKAFYTSVGFLSGFGGEALPFILPYGFKAVKGGIKDTWNSLPSRRRLQVISDAADIKAKLDADGMSPADVRKAWNDPDPAVREANREALRRRFAGVGAEEVVEPKAKPSGEPVRASGAEPLPEIERSHITPQDFEAGVETGKGIFVGEPYDPATAAVRAATEAKLSQLVKPVDLGLPEPNLYDGLPSDLSAELDKELGIAPQPEMSKIDTVAEQPAIQSAIEVTPQELESVKYNGIQKGYGKIPDSPMYTADIDGVQTTFVLEKGETLKDAIARKKQQKLDYDKRAETSGNISIADLKNKATSELEGGGVSEEPAPFDAKQGIDLGEEAERRAQIVEVAEEAPEPKKGGLFDILKNEAGVMAMIPKKGFYSKLADVVSTKMSGKMDADQLRKMLKNNGVADAEIENVVGALKGSVTKQQVLEEIASNSTEFKDVELGGDISSTVPEEVIRKEYEAITGESSKGMSLVDIKRTLKDEYDHEFFRSLTFYKKYTEPGYVPGSYRELFVTVPNLEREVTNIPTRVRLGFPEREMVPYLWKDGHTSYADIKNPIVRIRLDERDINGKKTLFIEEIQGPSEANQAIMPEWIRKRIYDIGVKRTIQYAKENGFDEIAWTTGKMQADRYNLSNVIDQVEVTLQTYTNKGKYEVWASKDGKTLFKRIVDAEELPNFIGKDLAAKALSKINPDTQINAIFQGLDLEVGGEGLKRLYDQTLPALFKKYSKENVTIVMDVPRAVNGRLQYEDIHGIKLTSKTPSSFTMYSGLDVTQTVEVIKGLKDNIKEAYPHIEELGRKVYESGKTRFAEWVAEMKRILGDLYKKFESVIQDVWSASMRILNNERGAIGADIKRNLKDARKLSDEYLGAISTRLENIDPSLKYAMRRHEFNTRSKIAKLTDKVLPLINATEKMSKSDKSAFDLARKNADGTELKRLVTKYKIGREYHELKTVLNDLRQQAFDVGYKSGYVPNYHPRELKDPSGFLDYMYNSDDWSAIDYAIKRKEQSLNRALEDNEKAKIINSLLRGYSTEQVTLSKPGQLKFRTIKEITPELDKFYADSNSALLRYINDVSSAVEAKKLFGVNKFGNTVDLNSTIGSYVLDLLDKGVISPKQERELTAILKARFNPIGASGVVSTFKNLSYMDTMGSPTSAIVQIGDLVWPLYENGIGITATTLPKAVVGKSKFTKKDLYIDKIAAEFSDKSKTAKLVDRLFNTIGLTKIDAVGKETLINGAYIKASSLAQTEKGAIELAKELKPMFGKNTDVVIKDFKDGEISERVKFYLFNKVSDFQPVSELEVPEKYLTAGNGRVFYMLKTFTLKMFDVFRRECFRKIANEGTRLEGMRNLIKLAGLFIVANSTADVIQDLLLGRPIELSDAVIDNIFRMSGATRYTTHKVAKEGVTGFATQVLPPFKAANALIEDIRTFGDNKGFELTQSIPIFGKLYYWWFGKGAKKLERQTEKEEKTSIERKTKEERERDKARKLTTLKGIKGTNALRKLQ